MRGARHQQKNNRDAPPERRTQRPPGKKSVIAEYLVWALKMFAFGQKDGEFS